MNNINRSDANKIIKALEAQADKTTDAQVQTIIEMMEGVLDGEREEVMDRCATFCVLSRDKGKHIDWFAESEKETMKADEKFVEMTPSVWQFVLKQAKYDRWFKSYDDWHVWVRRVDGKRKVRMRKTTVIEREVDAVSRLLSDRRDIKNFPATYASTQDGYDEMIESIETAIVALPTGKWRLELEFQKERPAFQGRIDEIVHRVKSLAYVKETVDAARLQCAWRAWRDRGANAGPTCDSCGEPRTDMCGRTCEVCDWIATEGRKRAEEDQIEIDNMAEYLELDRQYRAEVSERQQEFETTKNITCDCSDCVFDGVCGCGCKGDTDVHSAWQSLRDAHRDTYEHYIARG